MVARRTAFSGTAISTSSPTLKDESLSHNDTNFIHIVPLKNVYKVLKRRTTYMK